MTVSTSIAARNAAGNAVVTLINEGSANPSGTIEIRTGNKPPLQQMSPTGTLLAVIELSNPAFTQFSDGSSVANTIENTQILANGTAGWFRFYNRNKVSVLDGTITRTGEGGDIEIDNINFVQGGTLQIVKITATVR